MTDPCEKHMWNDTEVRVKLVDALAALSSVAEQHKVLWSCVMDLQIRKSRLEGEVAELEEQVKALRVALSRGVPGHWGVTVGPGKLQPDDTSWVDRTPRITGEPWKTRMVLTAPAYTYALFREGKLLYIGFTRDWKSRRGSHRRKGYDEYSLEGWKSVSTAQYAEEIAIHERHPFHNKCPACAFVGDGGTDNLPLYLRPQAAPGAEVPA